MDRQQTVSQETVIWMINPFPFPVFFHNLFTPRTIAFFNEVDIFMYLVPTINLFHKMVKVFISLVETP